MKNSANPARLRAIRSVAGLLLILATVTLSSSVWGATPGRPVAGLPAPAAPQPPIQDFQDVPTSSPFYAYLHNLVAAGVVSGYTCGSPGEPCVAPANLPYYRPGNSVTRLQMSKFIDLGRRNIADAIGTSLALTSTAPAALRISSTGGTGLLITTVGTSVSLSSTTSNAIFAYSASGNDVAHVECTRANTACYALHSAATTGNYTGYLVGGRGLYSESDDNNYPAVNAVGYGTTSPGGEFYSRNYRSAQVDAPPASTGYVQLGVNGVGPTMYAERIFNGGLNVEGNLSVGGSKSGYVVDAMQNVDGVPLEPGDVVIIAGASDPIMGQIPVVTVRKASAAYDTRVAGIVDQVLYVPDAATRTAYAAQEAARAAAQTRRNALLATAQADGSKPDLAQVVIPPATITDEQGSVHALADATQVAPGGYANVVTLGAYRQVKVDASFGAIHAGDLLTTSPHTGYAMKVTDKAAAVGAILGKALADLETGTGSIPILVQSR